MIDVVVVFVVVVVVVVAVVDGLQSRDDLHHDVDDGGDGAPIGHCRDADCTEDLEPDRYQPGHHPDRHHGGVDQHRLPHHPHHHLPRLLQPLHHLLALLLRHGDHQLEDVLHQGHQQGLQLFIVNAVRIKFILSGSGLLLERVDDEIRYNADIGESDGLETHIVRYF